MRCLGNTRETIDEEEEDEEDHIGTKDPFMCTHYYIATGPPTDHTHEFTRLWGIEGLADCELLETSVEIYDCLSQLVAEAHRRLGSEMAIYSEESYYKTLPCMQETKKYRVIRTKMKDGKEVWEKEYPNLHHG